MSVRAFASISFSIDSTFPRPMSHPRKRLDRGRSRQPGDVTTIPREPKYTMSSTYSPVAPRLHTMLRYTERITNSGIATRDYLYNLNSLFDPNRTGGGHQPKGYDQISALYTRYRVFKVHYRVTFTSTIGMPAMCVVAPTNSASGYSGADDAAETTFSQVCLVNVYQIKTISGAIDLPTLNGKSHVAYASDDTTQALINASPSEVQVLHVLQESVDASTNLAGYVLVELAFEAEFSDPVQLAQS